MVFNDDWWYNSHNFFFFSPKCLFNLQLFYNTCDHSNKVWDIRLTHSTLITCNNHNCFFQFFSTILDFYKIYISIMKKILNIMRTLPMFNIFIIFYNILVLLSHPITSAVSQRQTCCSTMITKMLSWCCKWLLPTMAENGQIGARLLKWICSPR